MLNAICGFGKEAPSNRAISFISYAKYRGLIDHLVYSFEIALSLSE